MTHIDKRKKVSLTQTSEINWTEYSLKDHLIIKTCSIPNVAFNLSFMGRMEAMLKLSTTIAKQV